MMGSLWFTLSVFLLCLGTSHLKNVAKKPEKRIDRLNSEDIGDDTPTLIAKRGYPAETHKVVTEDGYILSIHRIPHGKGGQTGPRVPVLLQHGLMSNSADWVISPEGQALGFLLADAGFDVWLGNYRGNGYSRAHTTLDPDHDEKFWKYNWDEMGKYDLPAMYDHILITTEQPSLFHIGHSMGTTGFWIAMNERPEYNDVIKGMFALAPVAAVGHMTSPINKIAPYVNDIDWLLDMMGIGEFLATNKMMDWLMSMVCLPWWIEPICENTLFLLAGYDADKFNDTMLPAIVGNGKRAQSVDSILHYAQSYNSKEFTKFDYGPDGNQERYGQPTPPVYDMSKVTAPVALVWGENDWLGVPEDTMRIASGVRNLMPGGIIRVDFDKWNHLDFLWGIDAKPLVYDPVIELMNKIVNNELYPK